LPLRFLVAVWAFALLFTGSLGTSLASAEHHSAPSARVAYAQLGANQTSPDVNQWLARTVIVHHVHHAAAIRRFASRVLARTSALAARLTKSALRFLGVPYVFGGTSVAGFDCSGYVQHVFATLGIHLPRTADAQFYAGKRVRHLRPGDLVFFQTYAPGPSHVGIYLGHDRFVSAASGGVMVSSLHDPYWADHYIGAKNLLSH
jgi:cell wall-associated NlpC family hydrolase